MFRDDNAAATDATRYKAIGVGKPIDGRATLRGLTSPDGIHWQLLDRDPLILSPVETRPLFDSHNIAFWDGVRGQYTAYMRGWLPSGERSIRRSTSADFRNWSELQFIDMGDAPTEHLYQNACTPYFRAPHLYLMFPKRFVPERKFDPHWPYNGSSDSVFMTSRDGQRWN